MVVVRLGSVEGDARGWGRGVAVDAGVGVDADSDLVEQCGDGVRCSSGESTLVGWPPLDEVVVGDNGGVFLPDGLVEPVPEGGGGAAAVSGQQPAPAPRLRPRQRRSG